MRKYNLDKEEHELLTSIERGEWRVIKNMPEEIKKISNYAKNSLKKDHRISIRMSKQDFIGIRAKAIDEGIPYQTLITSLIHKYLTGKFIPKMS